MQNEDHFCCCGIIECYSGSKLPFIIILRYLKVSLVRLNDSTKVLTSEEKYKEISFKEKSNIEVTCSE